MWQGHQEIMETFVREGNKVLFIENTGIRVPTFSDLPRIRKRLTNWFRSFKGIRKERENLFVYSPVILPFPYSRIASFINRLIMLPVLKRWMKAADFTNPIIWTFLPTATALNLITNLDHELSIYYCIADFSELVRNKEKLRKSEEGILKAVDLVFAQGIVLKEHCLKLNKNVHIFPFGVKGELFNRKGGPSAGKLPDDLKGVKGARVCYVGGLHRHIDYELLGSLARLRPGWSIILIGPDQVNYSAQAKPENIILLGMKRHDELPDYIENMDICMIPYKINEYTRTVYPTKLNEYLLMGKPVISTALPEIEEFNRLYGDIVHIESSGEGFARRIEDIMKSENGKEASRGKEAAMQNTWENRIEEMSEIMEERIAQKAMYASRGWKENLAALYRVSKRRVIRAVILAALSYLLIFNSPLLWFVASPLKISQVPSVSDAIVVFGGGVGEKGSPEESTVERARYSVELYRKGLAGHIIYSSGYTFKYNDAENMKLFAISMGVPEEDIILEKRANSTYENVKYTSEILRKMDFRRMILVSSPYNMRRAELVARKTAKDIDIIYSPVPGSKFYYRDGPVKWEQIRAIAHEYLGILYYLFKGYI